ncbi:MAG: hypothetical protein QOE22_36 [Candidatus Parcubacteria bacterium]|jgi:hypothetical protein|nr:hypothetical protein [Candidatus Parcubacteria bacterium]
MENKHWLIRTALPVLVLILLAIGWIGYWLLTPSINDTHVPFYVETVRDNFTGEPEGEFLLNGMWRLSSEEEGYTGESVAISCRKSVMECTAASAVIYLGGWFDNQISHLKITEWSPEGKILATVTGECSTLLLTIESSTELVTLATTAVEGASEDACGTPEERTGTWELTGVSSSDFASWKGDLQYSFYSFLSKFHNN